MIEKWKCNDTQVDCVKWTGENIDEVRAFLGSKPFDGRLYEMKEQRTIRVLVRGPSASYVQEGDWFVRTPDGEVHIAPAAKFEGAFVRVAE